MNWSRFSFVAALWLFLLPMAVWAQQSEVEIREYATIQRSVVNLRDSSSIASSIIGQVKGEGEYDVLSKSGSWIKIRHPQFGVGWVYHQLVTIRAESTFVQPNPAPAQPTQVQSVDTSHVGDWLPFVLVGALLLLLAVVVVLASRGNQSGMLHHHP